MSGKIILVVAAHPDDEILGCGGTMAHHIVKGNKVHIVFMSDGVSSRVDKDSLLYDIKKRKQSSLEASAILGTKKPIFLGFPDNQMDTCSMLEITQKLENVIYEIKPDIVYTHHDKDLNIDHQLTSQAVMTACRPQPCFFVSEIYSFEVLSSTGWGSSRAENVFIPNVFINIKNTWEKKIKALKCYDYELREFPHARSYKSIEALAIYRGSNVGIELAEAFKLERKINHL